MATMKEAISFKSPIGLITVYAEGDQIVAVKWGSKHAVKHPSTNPVLVEAKQQLQLGRDVDRLRLLDHALDVLDVAQAFGLASQRDVAALGGVVLIDHIHVLAALVGQDGLVVDQHGLEVAHHHVGVGDARTHVRIELPSYSMAPSILAHYATPHQGRSTI